MPIVRWYRPTTWARWQTLEWLGRINARGGTEMVPALQQAIEMLSGSNGEREAILVLVTDGQVAGEDVVIRSVGPIERRGRAAHLHIGH